MVRVTKMYRVSSTKGGVGKKGRCAVLVSHVTLPANHSRSSDSSHVNRAKRVVREIFQPPEKGKLQTHANGRVHPLYGPQAPHHHIIAAFCVGYD
jgi:hypothetical protein